MCDHQQIRRPLSRGWLQTHSEHTDILVPELHNPFLKGLDGLDIFSWWSVVNRVPLLIAHIL